MNFKILTSKRLIGETHTTFTDKMVNFGLHYCYLKLSNSYREKMCYAYYNITDEHMYSANGTDLGENVSYTESIDYCLLKDAAGNVGQVTMAEDTGYPNVIFSISDDIYGDDANFTFIQWNGTHWDNEVNIRKPRALMIIETSSFAIIVILRPI